MFLHKKLIKMYKYVLMKVNSQNKIDFKYLWRHFKHVFLLHMLILNLYHNTIHICIMNCIKIAPKGKCTHLTQLQSDR